ncbi:MAG TPA: helix-turn-helix transcriptional regulator [Bacteriovoracaceae bacterium]|nr:helix-turn-helix transcriptional regulator [Bacteriovoracaceae bacterium]
MNENGLMDEIRIGKVLSHLMKERKLTFQKLSELSGVSMSTLKGWAANVEPKSMIAVRNVARVFAVTSEFLIFGEDAKNTIDLNQLITQKIYSGWIKITIETPQGQPVTKTLKGLKKDEE